MRLPSRGTVSILLFGLIIRLVLAPFTVQSYDFIRAYYSALKIAGGVNPYGVYEFPYPPVMLYILSPLAAIYFGTGLSQEMLHWPSSLDLPSLLRAGFISVTLIGFDVPPPMFNLLFKIPMIVSDTAIALLLPRLVNLVTGKPEHAQKAMLLWYLNPLVIWTSSVHGAFDSIAVLFAILGFYYLIRSNFAASGFFLTTGAMTKLYPAFLIPLLFTASVKARRVSRVVAGIAVSLLLFLAPPFLIDQKSFLYILVANRPSALFVGGLNPFVIKYVFRDIETFVFGNSTVIFVILGSLLGLSNLLLCTHSWKTRLDDAASMNRLWLAAIVLSYIFLPLIIQPQYALWALPFMIVEIIPLASFPHRLHDVIVKIRIRSQTILTGACKLSYLSCFKIFWVSALLFEFSLQGPSVFLPAAMGSAALTDIFAEATVYWVRDLALIRTLAFFVCGSVCTLAYTMFLLKSVASECGQISVAEN